MDELITITLTHLEGPRAGEADAFSQPSIVVGRAPDSHLPFSSEKGVSGRHAEIVQTEGGRFEVVDHNSTNGTFVNEERVTRRVLAPGDKIRFGYMGPVLQVEWDAPRSAPPAPAAPPLEQFGTVFIQADQLQAAKPAAPAPAPAAPRPVAAPVAAPIAAAPVRPVAAAVAAPVAVAAAAPVAARAAAAPVARAAAPVESSMAAAASTAAPAAAMAAAKRAAPGGGKKYLFVVIGVFVVACAIVGGVSMFVLNR